MRQKAKKTINTSTDNNLPKTTTNTEKIIKLIYKYRFINTNQFQKLFHHKDPSTVQEWLKDLKDKKYINNDFKRTDIETNRQYAKHFLAPLGRKFLKGRDGFDIEFLERVYKEKGRKTVFKNHCTDIVDMFLFLDPQKEKDEELKFFTQSNLTKYDYFPDTELDAYVVKQIKNRTQRFFLHVFSDSAPNWLPRQKIRQYIDYYNDETWQKNTNTPFPAILFVLPKETLKFHILKYGGAVLRKNTTVDISIFLTTKDNIKSGNASWLKVE